MILAVVSPVFHRKLSPPEAIRMVISPWQMVSFSVIFAATFPTTKTVTSSSAIQPLEVPITVIVKATSDFINSRLNIVSN